jgi:enoyl-CoA hydratase/carnithine racemase
MMADLASALRDAAALGTVRVAILRGAGDRAFCTGYDLAELRAVKPAGGDEPPSDWASNFPELTEMLRAVDDFPVPLIAAMGGHAIGGGALLASYCDFRIARRGVRFQIPASRLGVLYPLEGIRRLIAVVGSARASSVLLRASPIDTEQGLACGLYESVVGAEDLDSAVDELARELAALAPLALRGLRSLVRAIASGSPEDELGRLHHEWTSRCLTSQDLAEGLAAAIERREPRFEGH